jgi:hypothetical protein
MNDTTQLMRTLSARLFDEALARMTSVAPSPAPKPDSAGTQMESVTGHTPQDSAAFPSIQSESGGAATIE